MFTDGCCRGRLATGTAHGCLHVSAPDINGQCPVRRRRARERDLRHWAGHEADALQLRLDLDTVDVAECSKLACERRLRLACLRWILATRQLEGSAQLVHVPAVVIRGPLYQEGARRLQ